MDELNKIFLESLEKAIKIAGTQAELAKVSNLHQGRISDYLNGRYDFNNITIGTLRRIFPELQMVFFRDQNNCPNDMEEELEKKVVEHFRLLSSAEKAEYMMLVAANFPDKIKAEMK